MKAWVPIVLWAVVAFSTTAALVHAGAGRTGEALIPALTAVVFAVFAVALGGASHRH